MEAFEALSEHLQFAEETELLQLDVAQQSVRLRQMQGIKQQRAINGNLLWLAHPDNLIRPPRRALHYRQAVEVRQSPLDRTKTFRF